MGKCVSTFACKQNIEPCARLKQHNVSPKKVEIHFSLRISFLKIMSNFVGKITPIRKLSAIYHTKISRTQHRRQRRRAQTFRPVRRSAASRSRLRRCGGVRKREVGGVSAFYFTLFQPFPSQGTHPLFAIYSFARGCAPPHTAKQRPHTGPLLYAIANASPGDAADSVGLAARSVSGDPATRRANAADGARESALDKPSRLLYTHTDT